MKQLRRYIGKDRSGEVTLICEDAEDMWHVYNIIRKGDTVKCSTFRKVVNESSSGSTTSHRVQTTLSVRVETLDFDTLANILHLKGRNVEANSYVKIGAYHTLDLSAGRKFTISKPEWDSIDIDRLSVAINEVTNADVAAVIMHEGLAHVCLLTDSRTVVRAKIDMQIPKKRRGFSDQHYKAVEKFLLAVVAAFIRHIDVTKIKCVIVASPGFLKENFLTHLTERTEKDVSKLFSDNRSKFLLVHSSNGFKHALKEILTNPSVANALSETKVQGEVMALNRFYELMANEPARAFYGPKHVTMANEQLAIDTLLISDSLFRSTNLETRRMNVKLVESVKQQGAKVHIFSSMHISGEQLSSFGGVAAILRFPLPDLEDVATSESEDETSKA